MKTTTALATTLTALLISSAASAAPAFRAELDPSGAVVCFTAGGEKAALADCDSIAPTFELVRDPSGAAMCFDNMGAQAAIDECETDIAATLEPALLDSLPDAGAARVATEFVAAVSSDDTHGFNRLIHPRGLHHGTKVIAASGIRRVVSTLGVGSYVGMPAGLPWNLRSETNWFSVFRGDDVGNTTIAYFERYRSDWRLVQIARVRFDKTAAR